MLSTKGVADGQKASKTLNPGLNQIKVNSIILTDGYEKGSYNVVLNVEGPDMGDEFEGFLSNPNDSSSPRHRGQVARVRMNAFAYKDGKTKSGIEVFRDQSILRALGSLATALGKREQLDSIEVDTIEELVEAASNVLAGETFINMVTAGKQYEDKNGYTKYDLFIPNSKDGKYAYEAVDAKVSKLMEFDPAVHIVGKPKPVDGFEAKPTNNSGSKDFDL